MSVIKTIGGRSIAIYQNTKKTDIFISIRYFENFLKPIFVYLFQTNIYSIIFLQFCLKLGFNIFVHPVIGSFAEYHRNKNKEERILTNRVVAVLTAFSFFSHFKFFCTKKAKFGSVFVARI